MGDRPPVEVGLVGAGPWARAMHAPVLAAGPETRLAAVWARRPDAARTLAADHGAEAVGSFEALLDRCEAVAFAVPPRVQAELAVRAARAGHALLLEKPVAHDLPAARRLADAVAAAGVVTHLVLTKRHHPATRRFLTAARDFPTLGARAHYLHGAGLTADWSGTWRNAPDGGVLLDLGPHLLDLLEAAAGPVTAVRATGDPARWTALTCTHASGVVSQAALSATARVPAATLRIELLGATGRLTFDSARLDHSRCWPVLRREFAAAVRSGRPSALDVHRGVMLQELLDRARSTGRTADLPGGP